MSEMEELQARRYVLWDKKELTKEEREELGEVTQMIKHLSEQEWAWTQTPCAPDWFDPGYAGESWSEEY